MGIMQTIYVQCVAFSLWSSLQHSVAHTAVTELAKLIARDSFAL